MPFFTHQEKIGNNSRYEIERICFLTEKYSKECKISFDDSINHILEKAGYKRCNYIPCDNDDLFQLMQLSLRYMKTYAMKYPEFIQLLKNCYDYCKINGYSFDISQTSLKLGG